MSSFRQSELAGRAAGPPVPTGGWTRTLAGAVLALCALFGAALAGGGGPTGSADGVDEYALKAAFLSKFVKFVTWPGERLGDKDALVLGVFGQDPFGKRLEELFEKRKEDERRVVIKRLTRLEELASAHVLFVPEREITRLKEILAAVSEASVLVVGESTDFAARGGAINFYTEAEKIRFEINPEAAKRHRLKISSDLLRLARIVKEKEAAKE